jgi:ribosomal protein S26
MKQFDTLLDSLSHQPNCPLCNGPVRITKGDTYLVSSLRGPKDYIIWSGNDTKIIAHLATNHIERLDVSCKGYSKSTKQYYNFNVIGDMYARIALYCVKCNCYGYVIQVRMNVEDKKIVAILLNSETVVLNDKTKDITHEIHNVYATEKTEYTTYKPALIHGHGYGPQPFYDDKSIELPLIPLNLLNPEKTVERIRNLLPFS